MSSVSSTGSVVNSHNVSLISTKERDNSKDGSNGKESPSRDLEESISPIIGFNNTYLDHHTANIRARAIPWDGYHRAGLILESELDLITRFIQNPKLALSEPSNPFIPLFFELLCKLVRTDTIQNILVLLDSVLEDPSIDVSLFYETRHTNSSYPYGPFIKLLRKDDFYIQLKSGKILAFLLAHDPQPNLASAPSDILPWAVQLLSGRDQSIADFVIQLLQTFLTIPSYRLHFYSMNLQQLGLNIETPPKLLLSILSKNQNSTQIQYEIIYLFWLLTFEVSISETIQEKYNIIPVFANILKSTIKEKVTRIIISTFSNLLSKAKEENITALIGSKVLNICDSLLVRKWTDQDIVEDIKSVRDELYSSIQGFSTWDEYVAEVTSGNLDWSASHENEKFWNDNVLRFNDNDHDVLKSLSTILDESDDTETIAVAVHDIGQYATYWENGKKVLDDLGIKTKVMNLMTHKDNTVKYHALIAVQKIMSHNW